VKNAGAGVSHSLLPPQAEELPQDTKTWGSSSGYSEQGVTDLHPTIPGIKVLFDSFSFKKKNYFDK